MRHWHQNIFMTYFNFFLFFHDASFYTPCVLSHHGVLIHVPLQELREENTNLEERTVELRNNLKDATTGLEEMTDELLRLKDALDESQSKDASPRERR
jgi:hypothetical protein